jgi:hypothetical protein
MILNEFDTSVIICKGEFSKAESSLIKKEYVTETPAVTKDLKLINPYGLAKDSVVLDEFNPNTDIMRGFLEKILDLPYTKRYNSKIKVYEFIISVNNYACSRYTYGDYDIYVSVNNTMIDSQYTKITENPSTQKISLEISVKLNDLRQLNEVGLFFKHKTQSADAYCWNYEIESYTDEELLSLPANDIMEFKVGETYDDQIIESTYSNVAGQTSTNEYKTISFSEDHSDISIYDAIGNVGDDERYLIVRLAYDGKTFHKEKYIDCILESKTYDTNEKSNKFYYEFYGRKI